MCTAVAFGFGIGLKDGVGKASEFFAGYHNFALRNPSSRVDSTRDLFVLDFLCLISCLAGLYH